MTADGAESARCFLLIDFIVVEDLRVCCLVERMVVDRVRAMSSRLRCPSDMKGCSPSLPWATSVKGDKGLVELWLSINWKYFGSFYYNGTSSLLSSTPNLMRSYKFSASWQMQNRSAHSSM